MTKNEISIQNITKKYKNEVVLGPINLKIPQKSTIAIFGDNGAGKTTLCEIISNSKNSSSGNISYWFKRNQIPYLIGMNFQDQSYPSSITVKEIVKFYFKLYKDKLVLKEFNSMLEKFSIKEIYKKRVNNLSGGQRQRVNLFLALFHKPKIFIGDEISTGLDVKTKVEMINFLKDQIDENNITIILVSHNWEEIQSLCKRIIFLKKGQIIDDTTVDKVISEYGSLLDYYLVKTNTSLTEYKKQKQINTQNNEM